MGRKIAVGGTLLIVMLVALIVVVLTRGVAPFAGRPAAKPAAAAVAPAPAPAPGRKIKARLFYVADDGTRLASVERDVAYGEGPDDQAREIIAAQIAPVAEPLVSAIPPGTTLRAVFITKNGDAYVDLSREARSAHPGGTVNELLTVYTIVNALTVNLPAIKRVQILVDGKEVDTLAGHVDLRHPLAKSLDWVAHDSH